MLIQIFNTIQQGQIFRATRNKINVEKEEKKKEEEEEKEEEKEEENIKKMMKMKSLQIT